MSEENINVRCDLYRKIFNSAIEKSVNLQEEELHSKGFGILEVLESELIPFDNSFETIDKVYKKLSDKNHKVAYNVNFIDTLDIVKTIENKWWILLIEK